MRLELEAADVKVLAAAVAAQVNQALFARVEALEVALIKAIEAGAVSRAPVRQNVAPKATYNRKEVMSLTGLGQTTIWRMEKAGQFPAHVALGTRRVAWRRTEVDAWIEMRQAA